MSFTVLGPILTLMRLGHLDFRPPELLVLVFLADQAREDGSNAYPSLATMRRATRLKRDTIIAAD